ncbi:MAG: hypothetical protein AAB845_00970, partial [Patescibacteria group bacterium]
MNISHTTLKQKGSVLVFSLIVLSFLLVASLSIATLTISETKSSIALDRSTVAFQIADSGAEIVLEQIYNNTCNGQRLDCLGTCSIQNGQAGITGSINNGTYRVIFYDTNDSPLSSCSISTWRDDVESIQSEG